MFNIDECILYRNFQQGDILEDMSRALEICCQEPEEPGKSKTSVLQLYEPTGRNGQHLWFYRKPVAQLSYLPAGQS